jgi:endonuclease YncB( thermonuclease family)
LPKPLPNDFFKGLVSRNISMRFTVVLFVCFLSGFAAALDGKVVSVSDGDTLTVLDVDNVQHKIRLAQIDAPEKAQPWGNRARESLMVFAVGKQVHVDVSSTDRYGRSIGTVFVGDQDASAHQLAQGLAWVYDYYVTDHSLYAIQAAAKASKSGLWADSNPIAPWVWRSASKSN